MNRAQARLVLLGCLLLFVIGSVVHEPSSERGAASSSRDTELYAAVVARLRSGDSYYVALGQELRRRSYPTASVFNWRSPVLLKALSLLPPVAARATLTVLGGVLLALSIVVLARRPLVSMLTALLLQIGAVVAVLVSDAVWIHEAWAGVLIAISVCVYQQRRWRSGALIGIAALFLRELTAPYAAFSGLIALYRRRWSEFVIWVIGALVYGAFFVWHARQVMAAQVPTDVAHHGSWLYFGGFPFVLSTLRTNSLLLVAPWWAASAVLTVLVAALACPSTTAHMRAVLVYLVLFAVIGLPFNFYWGLLISPTCALAAADGVDSIRDMLRKAILTGPASPLHE